MRLEALVKIVCAHARDDNGEDQQHDGENGESSQGLARRLVVFLTVEVGNVHADELEEEVGHGNEVHDDDDNHAGNGLAADPPGGGEEEEEGDDERDSGKSNLDILGLFDDDKELDGEGEEEEEVELEEGDVNLDSQYGM